MDWSLYLTALIQVVVGLVVLALPTSFFAATVVTGFMTYARSERKREEKQQLENLGRDQLVNPDSRAYTAFTGYRVD